MNYRDANTQFERKSLRDCPVRQAQLRYDLYSLLEKYAPQCPSPELGHSAGMPRFDALDDLPRKNYIDNADELLQPMKEAHNGFVKEIRKSWTGYPYIVGTEGIVSAAGGTYMPTFVVTLRVLRRTGCQLPVELFVKNSTEYEPYICETVLPALNAKCIVLSETMTLSPDPTKNTTVTIEHFQIKSFALLFSSFDNTIWLDADNLPLHNPTPLLSSKPFTSTGLLTWPDFWASTISPTYFNISQQPDFPTNARASTEAGMLLVSKRTHFSTLLLATYYNYYGPSHYYTLLSQGAPGEGDKDTFLPAASALGNPFHAVSEPVADLGRPHHPNDEDADDDIVGSAMLQADPIEDYELTRRGIWRVKGDSVAEPPRGFFVHAYNPEFNPGVELLGEKTHDRDGNATRVYTGPKRALRRIGYDAERGFWEEVRKVTCGLEGVFESWKNKESLCEGVKRHWEDVFESPDAEVLEFMR
ncbi:alpha-mannosyltransferase [Aspergillus ruber CBS 135680]|uniref:Nucleotide-diphospho-sugar transferase n=1 Tax=Aspergillus ruber (strain CBS 135680) TaxID=1388766 RepID=A0A017S116_ASPRC|nr:nucleotide-diphospho-sugar transferase [Aspergillus ruber CBS 135680]EYE90738.1 nucleotide-diphospho-sugar transferase [Aspergillus ruber CBS 135680]